MAHFKKYILVVVGCIFAVVAKAQIGYDYSRADIGIGADFNTAYTDAETLSPSKSVHFNYNYNIGPYINYVVELQYGELKGGDSVTTVSGRQFVNKFTSVILRAQLQAGELIDYSHSRVMNGLKNLYVSTGIGFVVNNITTISRYSSQIPGYSTPGVNNSNNILIPARIGYEFKVFDKYNHPNFKVDLGYQYNFILGDDIDGFRSGKHDGYGQYTIGVKFAIGEVTSYKKTIGF